MALSGKTGKVYKDDVEVADILSFTVNESSDNKQYASSSSSGIARIAGHNDWSGTIRLLFPTSGSFDLDFDKGELFAFKGESTTGKTVSCASSGAIVDSVEYEVNVETGDIIGATISFSRASGNLTVV